MRRSAAGEGRRVLICAPFGRDAGSVAALLGGQGYDAHICPDLVAVARSIDEHIGAVLLTEEALVGDLQPLVAAVEAQPSWSDVPFVLLASPRKARAAEAARLRMPAAITNVLVLERPLGRASLESAVQAVLKSRRKQFEMRDRLLELAESESRLRLATSSGDIGTWDWDPVNDVLRWDARCKALFGLPADRDVTYDGTFVAGLHSDDRDRAQVAVARALDPNGDGVYDIEYRTIGLEDGIERCVAAKGGAIMERGRAVRFIGTVRDVTAARAAERALARSEAALQRESRELDRLNRTLETRVAERTAALEAEMATRRRTEEALRQSQKMEAVGQLTGGIAHDFNNMLTGVIGAIEIIQRRLAAGRTDDLDRFMDAARTSAQRAAALTARLLAFSRRQSLDAKPIDVNALILSLEDLLRRSVRENIALRISPGGHVMPRAVADANQLENAILNLVINARDAMPDGGRLTVETSAVELDEAYAAAKPDVAPGRYVVIAVSDTGVGIPADVMDRVFEPFFSTKPTGQGTGLGLSMVYGFARQSGGQVRLHSRIGQGTSVKLYLPVADGAPVGDAPPSRRDAREGAGQTVLLVEDDPSVRLLVRDVLQELRYATVEAGSADEALPILRSDRALHLMVSDVGLPGMNGRELAELAREHRPDLPILFVTGYAENAAVRAGFLGAGMDLITKPFLISTLSEKIAEMVMSDGGC